MDPRTRRLRHFPSFKLSRRWVKCWCYITHASLSPHKIFTNICQALDYVWIFARTGWRCLPWEGVKSYKWGSTTGVWIESDICGLAASACCYSFYRNKCFVSSNTAERKSSEWEALSLWDFNVSSLYHFGRCSGDINLRMEILAPSSFIILPLNETRYNCHYIHISIRQDLNLNEICQKRYNRGFNDKDYFYVNFVLQLWMTKLSLKQMSIKPLKNIRTRFIDSE